MLETNNEPKPLSWQRTQEELVEAAGDKQVGLKKLKLH